MRPKKAKNRERCTLCRRFFFTPVPTGRYSPVCGNCIVKRIETRHEEERKKSMKNWKNDIDIHRLPKLYECTCFFCKKLVKTSFPDLSQVGICFICDDCLYDKGRRKIISEQLATEDTEVID